MKTWRVQLWRECWGGKCTTSPWPVPGDRQGQALSQQQSIFLQVTTVGKTITERKCEETGFSTSWQQENS